MRVPVTLTESMPCSEKKSAKMYLRIFYLQIFNEGYLIEFQVELRKVGLNFPIK